MALAKHRVVEATKARTEFSDLTNRVAYGRERLIVGRRGKMLMAMIPIEDLELLEALENARDLKLANEALNEPGATSWKKFKADRGL